MKNKDKKTNEQYWEDRLADSIWKKYNNQEQKHIDIANTYLEVFKELDKEISSTLIKINNGKPMLSDMHKYNRLVKLEKNLKAIVDKYIKEVEKSFLKASEEVITEVYKDTMIALGGIEFALPNKELIEYITEYPWSGSYFSERLWKNTDLLNFNVTEVLRKGLTQGMSIAAMTEELRLRIQREYNICLRLVRTETMAYLNQSSLEAYKSKGVKKVMWWTAMDERVSSECKPLHGRPFDIDSLPMMPKHANCRCTWIPVIEV